MRFKKILGVAAAAVSATAANVQVAFASANNPMTGDEQGRYIGIVIAVAAVALIVIIVVAAISSKKSGK